MDLLWNPWNVWKQTYDLLEQTYSESIQNQMHEESFAAWIGICQQWFLLFQDVQNQSMTQWLEAAKIPSKYDLAKVSSLVIQVEEKMEMLQDKLEDEIHSQLKEIRQALDQLASRK